MTPAGIIAADRESLLEGAPLMEDLEVSERNRYEGSLLGNAFGGGCAAYTPEMGLAEPWEGIPLLPFCIGPD